MYVSLLAKKNNIQNFDPARNLQEKLEHILENHANSALKVLKTYPARTAPSGYRRTGRLRDEWRWFWSNAGSTLHIILINDAAERRRGVKYGTFVQGRKQSDAARDIGWKTAEEIVDKEAIAKDIQQEINNYLGKALR